MFLPAVRWDMERQQSNLRIIQQNAGRSLSLRERKFFRLVYNLSRDGPFHLTTESPDYSPIYPLIKTQIEHKRIYRKLYVYTYCVYWCWSINDQVKLFPICASMHLVEVGEQSIVLSKSRNIASGKGALFRWSWRVWPHATTEGWAEQMADPDWTRDGAEPLTILAIHANKMPRLLNRGILLDLGRAQLLHRPYCGWLQTIDKEKDQKLLKRVHLPRLVISQGRCALDPSIPSKDDNGIMHKRPEVGKS